MFNIYHCDNIYGLENFIKNNSIKLIYGSPPYPNAKRDYGIWEENEWFNMMTKFLNSVYPKLNENGFIIINVKSNRVKPKNGNSKRSLIVEKLCIWMEEKLNLHCVDIEIWAKTNPMSTGLRCACQDAYEQNIWFAKNPNWKINIDNIRRPYTETTLKAYQRSVYKPKKNGVGYITKEKKISPNPIGALPINIINGPVANNRTSHQAVQPDYLPEKYIKACTDEYDLVIDPWCGSGTTGLKAISLKRNFVGFEIIKEFQELSLNRINEYFKLIKE